ncbi:MAG: cell division protein SepF [Candidatus Bathyarchaeota archaeon]|nr:cell division protein SepF [Candidatus Bathyarchaeota archaeon]MCX8177142.1 cell division protein SepF [Candidatus Bathyarchaeota archaeon]MDW8193688.1 cell division protein SepF [Nitrososphaerota archaeon]
MPNLINPFRRGKREDVKPVRDDVKAAELKIFLRAMPLRDLADVEVVKNEVRSGKIVILKITPLANKNIDDVKRAVNELCEFVEAIGGDIARLGEERVVVCPSNVRIWREKVSSVSEPIPTTA